MAGEWLSGRGDALVNEVGERVVLRGIAVGGWMNMENFITGHPATEQQFRGGLARVVGAQRAESFFDRWLEAFYSADDANLLASLGFNCIRIPINYRHFEDDLQPLELKEAGFRHLDRAIELNSRRRLYSVIDLHAAQGWQNHDWHSDNITGWPLLWSQRCFQDRVVWLWEQIARRYRDNGWVAGYNLLNEPADEAGTSVGRFCRRLIEAVRAVDGRHLVFLDGNMYGQSFEALGDPIPGVVYSLHQYPEIGQCGSGVYPGMVGGVLWDRAAVEQQYLQRSAYMRAHGLPTWVGEFAPVYEGDPAVDASRLGLLRDQLAIYEAHGVSWSAWTYKDIGIQGIVCVGPESPWMRATRQVREKKARLAADLWGVPRANAAEYMAPIEAVLAREFGERPEYFSSLAKIVRARVIADRLVPEFVACFRGLDDDGLAAMADSFRLDRCVRRPGLSEVFADACARR